MADELSGDTWGERFVLRAAARIRDTRRAQGYSVRELAERTKQLGHEVTRQVLVNLEAGRRGSLSIDDLFVIAHALGVNPLFLLFDHGQMGRANEVLPELEVPEWMALQWARSGPSEISTFLYEGDFDDARSTIAQREQLDRLESEVFFLEHHLETLLHEGKLEQAEATRATIAAHRNHQASIRSMLESRGAQMNEAWFSNRLIRAYEDRVWNPGG